MKDIAEIFVERLQAYRNLPPPTAPRKKLLVVDDDASSTEWLKELFEGDGYDVTCSQTPSDAVAAVSRAVPFSAVLLDLNFKGSEDGISIMEAIRKIMPQTPIAIISNHLDEFGKFKQIAGEMGIAVISKTERNDVLRSAVANLT